MEIQLLSDSTKPKARVGDNEFPMFEKVVGNNARSYTHCHRKALPPSDLQRGRDGTTVETFSTSSERDICPCVVRPCSDLVRRIKIQTRGDQETNNSKTDNWMIVTDSAAISFSLGLQLLRGLLSADCAEPHSPSLSQPCICHHFMIFMLMLLLSRVRSSFEEDDTKNCDAPEG